MHPLINFDNWKIDEESPFGSGASEKHWLKDIESNNRGIFKYPKIRSDSTITGEYWAEKLASELAIILGIESATVDIGIFNRRIGSMSYMLLKDNEELIEGIQYIAKYYPNYNSDKFEDVETGTIYSVQMVMHSLNEFGDLKSQFLKIPMFDCMIGNSDRHHSNWAVIKVVENGGLRISPVYDNGSSLCCYVNPEKISSYLSNKEQFESLIYGRSKSLIGWDNVRKPRHFDLFKKIVENYYEESKEFVLKLKTELTDECIENIINQFDDEIISKELKMLLNKFLIERRNRMIDIFDQRKEATYE